MIIIGKYIKFSRKKWRNPCTCTTDKETYQQKIERPNGLIMRGKSIHNSLPSQESKKTLVVIEAEFCKYFRKNNTNIFML